MKYARRVREGRPFRAADLILYGVMFLLVAALFLFVTFRPQEEAEGFCVEVNGARAYSYVFGEGGEAASGWEQRIIEQMEGELLIVTVQTAEGAWNQLAVDEGEKTVRMRDANCSLRKDCTAMQPIGTGGGVIVCVPHALRVIPLAGEDLTHPSVG